MQIPDDRRAGAIIDSSGRYRYALWRCWQEDAPKAAFVMLNPSTADDRRNDPTIARCIAFAKAWGYGSLEVVNLFAYRTAHPDELMHAADPVGKQNDAYMLAAVNRSDLVLLAWGTRGSFWDRHQRVLNLLSRYDLYALGLTKDGFPRHPLYIRADSKPIRYRP
ncbi:DUF1643 domain-containing protein [Paenibacillus humicola]|uniref:DUF1643 domain-containing protein n=1 Tax=Paenibacillus humicola TaxID=3110540 RepID=UPI00237B93B4|nr:DUF1643 domain-containing protein [Paenibacillus humicola]